jgi:hypothetical protein
MVVEFLKHEGIQAVFYTDDVLIVGKDYDTCLRHRDRAIQIFVELGIWVAMDKVTKPVTVATFLGITIDTNLQIVYIDQTKLDEYLDHVQYVKRQGQQGKYIPTSELQSLVGELVERIASIMRVGKSYI